MSLRVGSANAAVIAPREQPSPFKIVTFNSAVGNSKYDGVNQADMVKLPFYQANVRGEPDAPILALQEVGKDQAKALREAAKSGNFQLVEAWPRGHQGNVLVIPKRFEIVKSESRKFSEGHLEGAWNAVKGWFNKRDLPTLGQAAQLVEPRMYSEVVLRDKESGRTFTVFNTHISIQNELRLGQAEELFERVNAAKKRGPVILAGDLNTRTAEDDNGKRGSSATDAKIRELFEGMVDLGPSELPPNKRPNIDYVLASGFDSGGGRYYTGNELSLPNAPTAEKVSDHYAEEDVVIWK